MPNVLVVDDSPMDRFRAGALLEKGSGFHVQYAEDGVAALALIESSPPDVVVTDLQMPRMNGLELVEAVRRDHPLLPVVLMTAIGSEEIAVEALRKGAASYVPKSLLADQLVDIVERILAAADEDRCHSRLMHSLEESDQIFVLRNDPELVETLINCVQETLRSLPLSDESERLRVGVALKQALLHAHFFGNLEIPPESADLPADEFAILVACRSLEAPFCERSLRFRSRVTPQRAEFEIRHDGPGGDLLQSRLPKHVENFEQSASRGWILMQSVMDEIRLDDRGRTITLVKNAAADQDPNVGLEEWSSHE